VFRSGTGVRRDKLQGEPENLPRARVPVYRVETTDVGRTNAEILLASEADCRLLPPRRGSSWWSPWPDAQQLVGSCTPYLFLPHDLVIEFLDVTQC